MTNKTRDIFKKLPNKPKVITISEGLPTKESLEKWDWYKVYHENCKGGINV